MLSLQGYLEPTRAGYCFVVFDDKHLEPTSILNDSIHILNIETMELGKIIDIINEDKVKLVDFTVIHKFICPVFDRVLV